LERIEQKLKNEMKTSDNMAYPDFDKMWSSIQQGKLKIAESESTRLPPRQRKRFALVAGLAIALMATPVYAALNYDWSSILSYREGIQTALEQGLGQKIEQSITKQDITLTVHTAFIDDNRTFLLYTLKPNASWKGHNIGFDRIGLKDEDGNFIEGDYVHQWNKELGVFQGYFETSWVAQEKITDTQLTMENIYFIGDGKQSIDYDPTNNETQIFPIHKDGIDNVTLQAFEQGEGRIVLQSAVTFSDADTKNKWVRILAKDPMNKPIQEAESPVFGKPEDTGAYINQQVFTADSIRAKDTSFELSYMHNLGVIKDTWRIDMKLSKKQLKNSSSRDVLNIPLENVPDGTKVQEMTVTPTQIRLLLTSEEKYTHIPYTKYQLAIGGKLLDGGRWEVENNPYQTELRFAVAGLSMDTLASEPLTLIAKHRVDVVDGDDQPVHLTNISAKPQSKTSTIGGYPITWTYYTKDNNLYVESSSSDAEFGGVAQTYYLHQKKRNYGTPLIISLYGDDSNMQIDEYQNFKDKELAIYIWQYTTNDPNAELHVPLTTEK